MSVPVFAAEDFPTMLETFGESITHRPRANAAQDAELQAIVILRGPQVANGLRGPQEAYGNGRTTSHLGEIYIEPGPSLHESDLWIYGGDVYAVDSIGKNVGGRIVITLKQSSIQTRKNGYGAVM
ncbi:hypothetical protein SH661x_000422 [Planctomicrobium sp. SH661]|uniref:hypothetical protein n=1 Tax=Planctomicrobium sp. SH661 TaxID=3448124 RepID=UPI003F5B4055